MATGSGEFSKEAKAAIAVMRSLIISEKGTSSLFRILGDFRKEEGHPLMYKNFGYPTAATFLEATGEFVLREQMGEIVIFVKPSKESNHIQKMIAAQKSSGKKAPQKRYGMSTSWNNTPYQTNRYPSNQYKSPYQQQQQPRSYSSFQQPSKPAFNQPRSNSFPAYQQQQQPKTSVPYYQQQQIKPVPSYQQQSKPQVPSYQQQQSKPPVSSYQQQQRYNSLDNPLRLFNQSSVTNMSKPAPTTANQCSNGPTSQVLNRSVADLNSTTTKTPTPQAIKVEHSVEKPLVTPKEPSVVAPPVRTQPVRDQQMDTTEKKLPAPRVSIESTPAVKPAPIARPTSSVQNRLDTCIEIAGNLPEKTPAMAGTQLNQKKPEPVPSAAPSTDHKTTPEQLLFQYGQCHGSVPMYKYFEVANKRFHCKVTINGMVFRTYPNDYGTEAEGKTAVAQIALEAIRRNEECKYAECDDTDAEIAAKIYRLLVPCRYGMLLHNIPNAFRDAYGALLPKHWKKIVHSYSTRLFKAEEIPDGTGHGLNLFAIKNVNLINLPWAEEYWDLFVTNAVSPGEIWARLVGPDYSDQMDAVMTRVEISMGNGGRQPKAVEVGSFYLAQLDSSWHRVRVEQVNEAGKCCECFFLDIGGSSAVRLDQIYVCDQRFLELPAQSICFSLDELRGSGGSNSKVQEYLQQSVDGRVLKGKIHTSKQQHDGAVEYGDTTISATLFDTSTDEDININAVLKDIRNDSPER